MTRREAALVDAEGDRDRVVEAETVQLVGEPLTRDDGVVEAA